MSIQQAVADRDAKQAEIQRQNLEAHKVFSQWKGKMVKAKDGLYKGHTGRVVGIDPRPRHYAPGMWLQIRCFPDTPENHVAPSETASMDMFHCLPEQLEVIA